MFQCNGLVLFLLIYKHGRLTYVDVPFNNTNPAVGLFLDEASASTRYIYFAFNESQTQETLTVLLPKTGFYNRFWIIDMQIK